MIRCFEATSGLKVNLHKSRMYGVENVVQIDRLAVCLGCSVEHLPTTLAFHWEMHTKVLLLGNLWFLAFKKGLQVGKVVFY